MSGVTLLVLAWVLLAVFAVTFVVRTVRIARLPVHLRWELAPVPKERTRGRWGGSYLEEYEWWRKPREESRVTELLYMLKEILLLRALWEHNRRLWWFSFPFHWGLYLLSAATASFVVLGGLQAAGSLGTEGGLLSAGLLLLVGAGYVLGAVGAVGLLASRLLVHRLRAYTTPVALFNLLLLAAVFATGAAAVVGVDDFPGRVAGVAAAVWTGHAPAPVPGVLGAHLVLALVFLAYLPSSQMMHFVAKYFTYHQVRWDDRPLEAGSSLEKELTELLRQAPTWAGPHVGADGRKSWVEIAAPPAGEPPGEEEGAPVKATASEARP